MYFSACFVRNLSLPFYVCLALLFGGDTNPAHPKHIGSIDPTCSVADVVKGKETGCNVSHYSPNKTGLIEAAW